MVSAQTVRKNIQRLPKRRMVRPTSSDLEFDFSLTQASICCKCKSRQICQISSLLNLPVKSCKHFVIRLEM